jgi:hypothetical protein
VTVQFNDILIKITKKITLIQEIIVFPPKEFFSLEVTSGKLFVVFQVTAMMMMTVMMMMMRAMSGPVRPIPGPVRPIPGPMRPIPGPVRPMPGPVRPVRAIVWVMAKITVDSGLSRCEIVRRIHKIFPPGEFFVVRGRR